MAMMVWVCLMLLYRCSSSVGVWVDDGYGRMVLADHLDEEDTADLARQMLLLLDLPAPPAHGAHHHHGAHYHHAHDKGSAPAWIKSIYDTLDERGHAHSSQMDPEHRAIVTAADTIITFVTRDPPAGRPVNANKRLSFDVSDVPLDHSLLSAELRVYRHMSPDPVHIRVYMQTDKMGSEEEVASVLMTDVGWVTLNVTVPALSWLIFPDTNHGLRLAATRLLHKHEIQFHEAGISGAHDEVEFRPFLVGFFGLPECSLRTRLQAAVVSLTPPTSKRRSLRNVSERDVNDASCQMRYLHVSFKDLGWEDWVIAPDGYDANYCEGKCQFPLQANMNATNHAIIQTLVKVVGVNDKQGEPPAACCAPRDLATISVLYYAYTNKIVLKKYPKMIVKNCGCQ